MQENNDLMVVAVVVPWNFDVQGFHRNMHQNGMCIFILDPFEVHPLNVNTSMFGARARDLTTAEIDSIQNRHSYGKYNGPDKYIMVLRESQVMSALRVNIWRPAKDMPSAMSAAASNWGLLWKTHLLRLAQLHMDRLRGMSGHTC
jgi:hypothetical protein